MAFYLQTSEGWPFQLYINFIFFKVLTFAFRWPIAIDTKDHKFRYSMTALSSVDHNLFLKSEKIEEKMLAILGKIEKQDPKFVLERILMDIRHTAIDELSADRYLQ